LRYNDAKVKQVKADEGRKQVTDDTFRVFQAAAYASGVCTGVKKTFSLQNTTAS